ncbi:MobF family relaxase [Massilia sp. R2A-15]|uniref:MobF family relaxase n=1 Tax=Massilia sp. R2A-15 TaxID=3064278 RepID=UPI0027359D7A|nr:MobF family relaxase [Massilia sp. R2A-15]WLI87829.1 MobF family relaxase [Massilia sp. R2A-15]
MLSFKFISSSKGAQSYYENEDDYYLEDDHQGQWEGKGTELLALAGDVDRDTFKNLLEGILPDGRQIRTRITHKQGDGKDSAPRLGIDFTFSAPKSVSIAALVNHDAAIVRAHDDSVRAAIAMLETKVLARKKVNGVSYRQRSGNLVVAAFRHDLSRSQDPQLHTHAIAMNMTQRDDGRWVALTNDDMLKSVRLVGAYYRSQLAQNLLAQGYAIRSTRDGFELADVPDQAIDVFSQRARQVEAALAIRGLDRAHASGALKQAITTATRPKKVKVDRASLRAEWTAALAEAKVDLSRALPREPGGRLGMIAVAQLDDSARRAVDFAIEHLAERQGIFTHGELLERAVTRSLGSFAAIEAELAAAVRDGRLVAELPLYQSARSFSREQEHATKFQSAQFHAAHHGDKLTRASWVGLTMMQSGLPQAQAEKLVGESIGSGRLVEAEGRFTTPSMLATERAILAIEEKGRNAVAPVKTAHEARAMFEGAGLNEGQLAAASLILTTSNRVVGIQGYAGTGKSHMLSAAVDIIKAEAVGAALREGYTVVGIAPYASQNKALLDLGMRSQTLASFLLRKEDQRALSPKAIVFLDESSVVPAHQMRELMELVEGTGARLVLIGDVRQTQSVESGKPFEQLQGAGMSTAHLTEIVRQQTPELKAAVVSAAGGRIDAAVQKLNSHTIEIAAAPVRHQRIASDYAALPPAERERTLLVAGTNAARQSLNALVRAQLRLPDEHQIATYDSVDMTRAEKKMAGSFSPGQFIMLEGAAGQGLARREYYEVEYVVDKDNRLTVREPQGRAIVVDPAKLRSMSVFTRQTLPLARGDWVRITRNNTQLGLANGERWQVGAINKNGIQLSNGAVLSRAAPLHLQHGYASTVNSAQGLTTHRVLIDADTKSLTSNRAVFYVAISRPRHELTIYTDSRARMTEVMAREPKKFAALELRGNDLERKMMAAAMRRASAWQKAPPKQSALRTSYAAKNRTR